MEKREYWTNEMYNGDLIKGGIYYRSFDLNKFIEKVEEKEGKVVGLRFNGNNVELLVQD